jgi:glycosyltransferase involved in cell wall biosynthesis
MEAVPPQLYGGTERIVSYLSDELVAMGHDVTLFASGDSTTDAKLAVAWQKALRLDPEIRDCIAPHIVMLEMVAQRAHEFDIVHLHVDYLGYPIMQRAGVPFVTTLHGRLDLHELKPVYDIFDDVPVVSISDSQRGPLPQANYVATVLHGLPTKLLTPNLGKGSYFAFLGRISPEKAPDAAIRIASGAGAPLKIAAKIDKVDQEYFDEKIAPMLAVSPNVNFVGEINEGQKADFLGNATALIFPIAWREPFGLVMIEAMACGTPVIAYRNGSVPEVIEDGVTGFIVETEEQAIAAAQRVHLLDRARIRQVFETRFSARRMAQDYVDVYSGLIAQRQPLLRVV